MALNMRPKRFGPIVVRFDGIGAVTFATDAQGPFQSFPPADKPVSLLLASVGHCLVESIRIVAARDAQTVGCFMISVVAEKALDLPGRLHKIECLVSGNVLQDGQSSSELVKQAKTICTISNTLNTEVAVGFKPD